MLLTLILASGSLDYKHHCFGHCPNPPTKNRASAQDYAELQRMPAQFTCITYKNSKHITQHCAGFCGLLGIVRHCAGLIELCGPAPVHAMRSTVNKVPFLSFFLLQVLSSKHRVLPTCSFQHNR